MPYTQKIDNPVEAMRDMANVMSAMATLLKGRDGETMAGLAVVIDSCQLSLKTIADQIEKDHANRSGHFRYMMSKEIRTLSRMALTEYGPAIRLLATKLDYAGPVADLDNAIGNLWSQPDEFSCDADMVKWCIDNPDLLENRHFNFLAGFANTPDKIEYLEMSGIDPDDVRNIVPANLLAEPLFCDEPREAAG